MSELEPQVHALQLRQAALTAWLDGDGGLQKALSENLVVAFLGSASSGKDSGIKALFGLDFGEVSPIPGSTDRIRVARLDDDGKVLLVNAPGFGDVRQGVDDKAREVMAAVDVVVYVLNCEGGATVDERNDLDEIRKLGRPVLVCLNKIDLIRLRDRESFVTATLAQLDVAPENAVLTAFDPLPQLAPAPIGLEEVVNWIGEQLAESGKTLLFAKHLRNKAAACEPIIQAAARNASMAGAVPIPGVDLAAVTAIQVKLIRDIATVHGQSLDRDMVAFILAELLAVGGRGFVRWGMEALKTAGMMPGGQIAEGLILAASATVAGASTYGVGQAAVKWIQSGHTLSADSLREVFDVAAFGWSKRPAGGKAIR
jgi:GTP-binding protein Era